MKKLLLLSPILLLAACTPGTQADLKTEIEAAKHCEVASDCVSIGSKCPLGCNIYVNASEADRLKMSLEAFESDCMYKCAADMGATCENNTCVATLPTPAAEESSGDTPIEDLPLPTLPQPGEAMDTCEVDSDCVGATCCHPTALVNKKYAPDCSATMCTKECRGPLECGQGRAVCKSNKCVIEPQSID